MNIGGNNMATNTALMARVQHRRDSRVEAFLASISGHGQWFQRAIQNRKGQSPGFSRKPLRRLQPPSAFAHCLDYRDAERPSLCLPCVAEGEAGLAFFVPPLCRVVAATLDKEGRQGGATKGERAGEWVEVQAPNSTLTRHPYSVTPTR